MAEDQATESKEDPERRKLLLEIADLQRPWWRKPSSFALFLPLAVALVSIFVGWRTGFFDNQRLVLEAQRHNLESQTRELRLEERGLQGQKAELLTQVRQLHATLADERESARTERETLASNLQKAKSSAASQIDTLKASVEKERVAAARAPIDLWVEAIRAQSQISYDRGFSDSRRYASSELIRVLKGNPKLVPFVVEAYEQSRSNNDDLSARLLLILYRATDNIHWRERIITSIEQEPTARSAYWLIVGEVSWDTRDLSILERLGAAVLRRPPPSTLAAWGLMRAIGSFRGDLHKRSFSSPDRYFELLRLCRDESQRVSSEPLVQLTRLDALTALARFSYEGAITIAAVMLTSPDLEPAQKTTGERYFSGNLLFREEFRIEARRLGLTVPETAAPEDWARWPKDQDWAKWIKDHPDLVTRWREGDLAEVRRRLSERS
jgi:hypothetical protein